jgi:hypothetical protein
MIKCPWGKIWIAMIFTMKKNNISRVTLISAKNRCIAENRYTVLASMPTGTFAADTLSGCALAATSSLQYAFQVCVDTCESGYI